MITTLVDFKDPTRLTLWAKWLSYVGIFASIFALVTGYWEYDFYQKLTTDFFPDEEMVTAAEDLKDKWVATAGIFQMALIFQFVALFMWVYRINSNTRALGVQDMKFTPGWSVIWFFIPIANIWKSYQVLKDLWQSNDLSQGTAPGGKQKSPLFIWMFWGSFLLSNLYGMKVAVMGFEAKELPELITLNKVTLFSDFFDIPFYIMTIILVNEITKLHMVKFAPHTLEYQKRISELPPPDKKNQKWTQSIWVKRSLLLLTTLILCLMVVSLIALWIEPYIG